VSLVDILLPAFVGALCGAAAAFVGLENPRLFWVPAAMTSLFLGTLVATVPLADVALAISAFFLLFLAAFWAVVKRWRDDGWRDGGDGDDPNGPLDPSWWSEFEAQFRSYARRQRLPQGSRR